MPARKAIPAPRPIAASSGSVARGAAGALAQRKTKRSSAKAAAAKATAASAGADVAGGSSQKQKTCT